MPGPSKNTIIVSGIIVPVVAALITALATDIGQNIKVKLFPPKVYLEGVVLQEGDPLSNIEVFLDNMPQSSITDNRGKFIFEDVPLGRHECNFTYLNDLYRYSILVREGIDQTVSEQFDIGAKNIKTPDKKPEKELIAQVPVTIGKKVSLKDKLSENLIVSNTETNEHNVVQAQTLTHPDILFERTQQTAQNHLSAADMVQKLELHVRVDKNDKNQTGKQFAFNYYIDGKDEYLDQIETVYYIRNHKTFSEFANDRYLTSYNRSAKFNYKGYQWGYISSVYVNILLKNGTKSDWVLKEIIYD